MRGATSTPSAGGASASPVSYSADLEGGNAQVMEKGKELPLKARAGNASQRLSYHVARLPRYLMTGCWGECIAQQGQSLWAYGTLLAGPHTSPLSHQLISSFT